MLNPKRFIPPPKQKAQTTRPSRPPPFVTARRLVARSVKTTRQRFEKLQLRCISSVQQFVENHLPPLELALVSFELQAMTDRNCLQVDKVVGTLLSGGSVTPSKDPEGDSKEEKFLVCEVNVLGANGELKDIAHSALTIKPNFSYTFDEVKREVDNIMGTGYFRSCKPKVEETRDGIVLNVKVDPNPQVTGAISTGGNALPQIVFQKAMQSILGQTMNYNTFRAAVRQINEWYEKAGIAGEVYDAVVGENDIAVLKIREGVVNRIDLRYLDAQTGDVKEEGSVKPEVIMRNMGTHVGAVVSNLQAQRDIETIFATGLFADVKLIVNVAPLSKSEGQSLASEVMKFDLQLDVYENRKSGGLGFGAGWSAQTLTEGSLPGFVGNVEYSEKNMFGLGQRLVSRMEFGQVDKLFKVEYNDPWIMGDKRRTSRTFGVMNTRTSGNPFYAISEIGTGIERFKTVIGRLLGSITMSRALTEHWSGTLGITGQRITLMDDNSRAIRQDHTRAPVNVSGDFHDLMLAPFFKAAFAGWANTTFTIAAEQAMPIRRDWLSISKLSARVEKLLRLGPVIVVLCGKGGAMFGKVPPYEAFPLGGINSIRGYREGSVGTARHFVEGTTELRIPIVSNLQGTIFFDCGTDFDTGSTVIGNPGHSRNKPGHGAGAGIGIRVDSPVGPLRLEWAWNDKRARIFHAGFGDHR